MKFSEFHVADAALEWLSVLGHRRGPERGFS